MRISIKKTVVAAVAALGMATAVARSRRPPQANGMAAAVSWRRFPWRRLSRGRLWRRRLAWRRLAAAAAGMAAAGAGPDGAAAGAGGARAGVRLGRGWGGGCWNCGWGWGGGWGWDPGWAIAAATVPLGVAIAANAAQPAYGGGPGCWVRRRVWTANGHYLGRRLVNLCY